MLRLLAVTNQNQKYQRKGQPMRQEYEVELKDFQNEYLNDMVKKYDLPDTAKAIRILIDFAIEKADMESEIFQDERCHSCD
tara:strand:- start:43 stop:285 length:243 start_codon:yes stop_codon:yes gene_type:complete